MPGVSVKNSLSPGRRTTTNSVSRTNNPYRRDLHSPSLRTPARSSSLSPHTTPSPQRKARSSTSVSLFTSFVRALKINPKKKNFVYKEGSPLRPSAGSSLSGTGYPGREGMLRMRSVPTLGRWDTYSPQQARHLPSYGDGMNVDDLNGDEDGEIIGEINAVQYLSYNPDDNPFATPPCSPTTPLSAVSINGAVTPGSSPDSVRSRKRRAAERSRMKTMQLLGPEASAAVKKRYGMIVE